MFPSWRKLKSADPSVNVLLIHVPIVTASRVPYSILVQAVGADVGSVGDAVGVYVALVGAGVGDEVGDNVRFVGAEVGTKVGTCDGDDVGDDVGDVGDDVRLVGAEVGACVGDEVGDDVKLVGAEVGTEVGTSVGVPVGDVLGASVKPPPHAQQTSSAVPFP
jgi:hypothetical protein